MEAAFGAWFWEAVAASFVSHISVLTLDKTPPDSPHFGPAGDQNTPSQCVPRRRIDYPSWRLSRNGRCRKGSLPSRSLPKSGPYVCCEKADQPIAGGEHPYRWGRGLEALRVRTRKPHWGSPSLPSVSPIYFLVTFLQPNLPPTPPFFFGFVTSPQFITLC